MFTFTCISSIADFTSSLLMKENLQSFSMVQSTVKYSQFQCPDKSKIEFADLAA